MSKIMSLVLLVTCCSSLCSADRKDLKGRYDKKYVVALRDGLSVGLCADEASAQKLIVRLYADRAEFGARGFLQTFSAASNASEPCGGNAVAEPIHKGEVLRVTSVKGEGLATRGHFVLWVKNVTPHQQERGVGAFSHETYETGYAEIIVEADSKDYDEAAAILDSWVKPFDSESEAAQFGNTASGVLVKEVRAGMTFAQVEAALGPPSTRVDLGEKVLYKYKELTVEFHDGKVTDVK